MSNLKNGDMPAMPQSGTEGVSGCLNSSEDWGGKGLTKLEHFAGLAMQGLFAADGRDGSFYKSMDDVAELAIRAAKALLQQLEGGEDE